ncbi:PRC-barrel domain-containing protein, partial [Acinetobacter baumannii]|uniref:PRC-barrel domain-containing protein n=1 Tax=Acinetobacter baumannii TaxID=470 RepID=UPI0014881B75
MKQSKQLIGMPIISIKDGKEIGKVKSLLINPDVGAVDFFIVHNDQWTLGIKV